jgi:hypothetical protein
MKESIQTLSASFPDLDQSELCAKRIRERCPGVLSVKIRYHSLPQTKDPQPKAVMPSSVYLSALGQANAGYFGGQPPLMLFSPQNTTGNHVASSTESRLSVRAAASSMKQIEAMIHSMGGTHLQRS